MTKPILLDPSLNNVHEQAFEAWLQSQQERRRSYRPSTVVLYREMWGSFIQWCGCQNPSIALGQVTKVTLDEFRLSRLGLKQDGLSPIHALRLLRLIDKVLNHVAAETGISSDAANLAIEAQPAIRYAAAQQAEPAVQSLDVSSTNQLMHYLACAKPRLGNAALKLTWHSLRNQVAVALQLGAGLGPAELRYLTLLAPIYAGGPVKIRPWKLLVPATGDTPAHEAPLAVWAAELLHYWLQVRAEEGIQGDWLFPSTRTGKQWGKPAQYSAARQVFLDAGIGHVTGGSFLLRHTFALRQLRRGTDVAQVAEWMGVVDPKVMVRYVKVLQALPDVV